MRSAISILRSAALTGLVLPLTLLFLWGSTEQAWPDGVNIEALGQAIGKPVLHDGVTNMIVVLSKDRLKEINIARAYANKKVFTIEEVNELPWVNKEYVGEWVNMLWGKGKRDEAIFKEIYGKTSGKEYDLRWKLYQAVAEKQKALAIPNPLPTDGRQPMPTRTHQSAQNRGEGR